MQILNLKYYLQGVFLDVIFIYPKQFMSQLGSNTQRN